MSLDGAANLVLGLDTRRVMASLTQLETRLQRLGINSFNQMSRGATDAEQRIRTLQAENERLTQSVQRRGRAERQATQLASRNFEKMRQVYKSYGVMLDDPRHAEHLRKAFALLSHESRATSRRVRENMEAMTAVRPDARKLNEYFRTMERGSMAINRVRAAEAALQTTSTQRTIQAVGAITAQNDTLARMRNHYANLEGAKGRFAQATVHANNATRALHESSLMLHSAFRGIGGSLGGLWMTYAKYVGIMVTAAAVTKTFRDSITRGLDADFQSQFASVLQTRGEFDPVLKDTILKDLIDVSSRSVFSVTENAEAMKKLALAGVDATTSVDLLTTASNAAIFAQTDLHDATTRVLDAVNNFALMHNNPLIMADNFERVANVMTVTASTVNASFTDISKAFENVTGVANSFNIEIEEASVMLQSMARTGIRGPRAGTFLRNFLDDMLGAPISQRAERELERAGIERYDPDHYLPGEKGVARHIDHVADQLRKIGREQGFIAQQNVIRAISNQRSRRLLRQEITETQSVLERTLELERMALAGEGALAKMAEGLTDNAQMTFRMAQASYDAAVTDAFRGHQEMFKDIGQELHTLFNSDVFREFIDWGVEGIGRLAGSLTTLLRWATRARTALEYMGNAVIWMAGSAVLGLLIKALKGLVLMNPLIFKLAAGITAVGTAFKIFRDINRAASDVAHLRSELELLEGMDYNPLDEGSVRGRSLDRRRDSLGERLETPDMQDQLMMEKIRNLRNETNEFERDWNDRITNMTVKAREAAGGFSASVTDVNRELIRLAEGNIGTLLKVQEEAHNAFEAAKEAGKDTKYLEEMQHELRVIGNLLSDVEEIHLPALNRFDSSILSSALGDLYKDVSELTSALESQNDQLREQVREAELGADGLHNHRLETIANAAAKLEAARAIAMWNAQVHLAAGEMDSYVEKLREATLLTRTLAGLEEHAELMGRLHAANNRSRGSRAGGGRSRADELAMEEIDDVRRIAEAEHRRAVASINFYREGLEIRKNARMVGELEYQRVLDELSDLEIQKSIERERKVQNEIENQRDRISDERSRRRLDRSLQESRARQAELETQALNESALRKMRDDFGYMALAEEMVEKAAIESGRRRINAAEQFAREWLEKYSEVLNKAFQRGDIETQQSLGVSFQVRMNHVRFEDDLGKLQEKMSGFRREVEDLMQQDSEWGLVDVLFGSSSEIERLKQERLATFESFLEDLKRRLRQLEEEGGDTLRLRIEIEEVERDIQRMRREVMSPTLEQLSSETSDYLASGIVRGFARGESPARAFARILDDAIYRSLSKTISNVLDQLMLGMQEAFAVQQNGTIASGGGGWLGGALGTLGNSLFGGMSWGNAVATQQANAAGTGLDGLIQATGGWGTMPEFAKGGVMTSQGELPLNAYAAGGIAKRPQLALFGEGRTPEAYVPLPDGRTIPVTMQLAQAPRKERAEENQRSSEESSPVVHVHNNFTINGPTNRRTQSQIASEVGASVNRALARNR